MLSKISLRLRLTFFTAFVILLVSILLTVSANFTADKFFVKLAPATPTNSLPVEAVKQNSIKVPDSIPFREEVSKSRQNVDPVITTTVSDGTRSEIITMSVVSQKHRFSVFTFFFMVLAVLSGSIAMWFMAGHILKPIHKLQENIDAIQVNNLSKRIEVPPNMDEIGKLSVSFNTMMDKIDCAFENQKRFASNAAHELKTPLAIMETNLEVLDIEEETPMEQISKAISAVKNNTERMTHLIENLFLLSTNQDYEQKDIIPMKTMINAIIEELQPMASSRNILLHFSPLDVKCVGSYTMLYRAFFNLIENAIKYNKEFGAVYISMKEENKKISIKISDTGIGISQEEQEYIFEPFYRIDKSRSRAAGGCGLGLTLVKTIVETHKGFITMESQLGLGSTFHILLPDSNL